MSFTKPASRNDDAIGATKTAKAVKTLTFWRASKRTFSPLNRRIKAAPRSASTLLLTNQQKIKPIGTPELSSTAMCAGSAASSRAHHHRVGASNSAASKIALGGQRVE